MFVGARSYLGKNLHKFPFQDQWNNKCDIEDALQDIPQVRIDKINEKLWLRIGCKQAQWTFF